MSEKKRPEFDLRDGALRAAVWRQEGEYGDMFNTRITRIYTADDGEIRETSTLREKDLLPAAQLASKVYDGIRDLKRDQKAECGEDRREADFHDEDKTRKDIQRERFKSERSGRGTRREKPPERGAR